MRESMIVNEWKAEAKAEGKAEGKAELSREILFDLLSERFPGQVREDLVVAIEAESDQARLMKAISLLLKVASIEEFRAVSGF